MGVGDGRRAITFADVDAGIFVGGHGRSLNLDAPDCQDSEIIYAIDTEE